MFFRRSTGFTLVELVVVILILGILAAVAAPKLLGAGGSANENSLKTSLSVLRDALDRYAAHNGGVLPGELGTEADFKADLLPYLRTFPKNPIKDSDKVEVQTTGAPLTFAGGAAAWRYDNRSGQLIANSNGTTSDGSTRFYQL